MSFLSKLFGSEAVIKSGIAGIDKAFYTKEEQADDDIKRIGFKLAFMKAYEPFKIAQRLLALIISIPFALIHLLSCVIWLISIFTFRETPEIYSLVVGELWKVADMNNSTLGEPLMWILIFYFAGGAGEGIISKWTVKKK